MKDQHLTYIEAIVLLDIFRGTFEASRHFVPDDNIIRLSKYGLVELERLEVTPIGDQRVRKMLG